MNYEEHSEAVLASLKSLGQSTPAALWLDTGINRKTLLKVLRRMAAAGTIVASGRRRGLTYALPGQNAGAPAPAEVKPPKVTVRNKSANKKRKAKAAKKAGKRKYTKRVKAIARAAMKLDAKVRAREAAAALNEAIEADQLAGSIASSFASLRFAFDQHLAAVTSARDTLFGESRIAIRVA